MIEKHLTLTYNISDVKLSEPVEIFRHDYGIEFVFNLVNFDYYFTSDIRKTNRKLTQSTDAVAYNMTIRKPYVEPQTPTFITTDIKLIEDKKLRFVVDKEMTNDLFEIGDYTLQFHLYDAESHRTSIPEFGFKVKPLLNPAYISDGTMTGPFIVGVSKLDEEILG